MKKAILFLLALAVPAPSFAAMTCVETAWYELPSYSSTKDNKYELHLTCTADTTPATMTATLSTSTMAKLNGKYLYTITTKPGGTAPKDDCDVAIADSRGLSLLSASGNGLNLVDATTTKSEYFEGPNIDHYPLINGAWALTLTVTNNDVNNSIVNFYIKAMD